MGTDFEDGDGAPRDVDTGRRWLLASALASAIAAALPRGALAAALGYPRALQGPMIGAPGPDHFTVWVRASGAFDVALEYSTDRHFTEVLHGSVVRASRENRGCVVLRADGLQAGTEYWYRLRFDGLEDRHQ